MKYILVEIKADGTIRATDVEELEGWETVVHLESRDIPSWGMPCYKQLHHARTVWEAEGGPDNDLAILTLDEWGGGSEISVGEKHKERLVARLALWKGCYGAWPVNNLVES